MFLKIIFWSIFANKLFNWILFIIIWIWLSYIWYNFNKTNVELKNLKNEIIIWDINNIDIWNENKILFFTWILDIKDIVEDKTFHINEKILSINKKVEMYQWIEKTYIQNTKEFYEDESINNNEINENNEVNKNSFYIKEETKYKYEKWWEEKKINSKNFSNKSYENPTTWKYKSETTINDNIFLWKLKVDKDDIKWIWDIKELDIKKISFQKFKIKNKENNAILNWNIIYIWTWNLSNPNIWDLKISFYFTDIKEISILWSVLDWKVKHFINKSWKKHLYVKEWIKEIDIFLDEIINNNILLSKITRYISILLFTIGIFLTIFYTLNKYKEDSLYT